MINPSRKSRERFDTAEQGRNLVQGQHSDEQGHLGRRSPGKRNVNPDKAMSVLITKITLQQLSEEEM